MSQKKIRVSLTPEQAGALIRLASNGIRDAIEREIQRKVDDLEIELAQSAVARLKGALVGLPK